VEDDGDGDVLGRCNAVGKIEFSTGKKVAYMERYRFT
jgi:hypothetical protein